MTLSFDASGAPLESPCCWNTTMTPYQRQTPFRCETVPPQIREYGKRRLVGMKGCCETKSVWEEKIVGLASAKKPQSESKKFEGFGIISTCLKKTMQILTK
ncbi:unnamed protein product [Scytosiphon promiscuus]